MRRRVVIVIALVAASALAVTAAPASAVSVATINTWQSASAWWGDGGEPFSLGLYPVGVPCGLASSCPGSLEDENRPLDWYIGGGVRRACDATTWNQIDRSAKHGDAATYTISPDHTSATVAITGTARSCGSLHVYTYTAQIGSTAPLTTDIAGSCWAVERQATSGSSTFRWDTGVTTSRGRPGAGSLATTFCYL